MKLETKNLDISIESASKLKTTALASTRRASSVRPSHSVKAIKSLRPKRGLLSVRKRVLASKNPLSEV